MRSDVREGVKEEAGSRIEMRKRKKRRGKDYEKEKNDFKRRRWKW